MNNPIEQLSSREKALWLGPLLIVLISNLLTESFDLLTMIAAMVGVTSLIFAAKGNVWAQILMILFSILYGIISYRFRYWGEMITYLGMTMPMAIWSTYTWLKNPSKENGNEVEIQTLNRGHAVALAVATIAVTAIFYGILRVLDTPNIVFSTISVVTSFLAASLTMLRSSYYAIGYAANDIVLIIMWIMATVDDPSYLPMIVCFSVFFVNDCYGFINWRKIRQRQGEN